MPKSANQMLRLIREPCRNSRKHHNLPTTLIQPVRWRRGHGRLLLSSQQCLHEKGGISAAFLQVLALRLLHPSSSLACDGTCTSWTGRVALVREWKMTSLPPCFWSSVRSPHSPLASLMLFSRRTHGLWHKKFLELSSSFVLICSCHSCLQVDWSLCGQLAVVSQRRCQPYFC